MSASRRFVSDLGTTGTGRRLPPEASVRGARLPIESAGSSPGRELLTRVTIFALVACSCSDAPMPPASYVPAAHALPVADVFLDGRILREYHVGVAHTEGMTPKLSRPAAIAEDASGVIWVLDSDWRRLYAFAEDGSIQAVLGGPQTAPWRALSMPTALAITPDSTLYILDFSLNGIATMRLDGSLDDLAVVDGRQLLGLAYSQGLLFAATQYREGGNAIAVLGLAPRVQQISTVIEPDTLMRQYSKAGSSGVIGTAPDGRIRYAPGVPGIWFEQTNDGTFVKRGRYLYEGIAPARLPSDPSRTTHVARTGAITAGQGNKGAVIVVREIRAAGDGSITLVPRIFVMGDAGEHFAELRLPVDLSPQTFLMKRSAQDDRYLAVARTGDAHYVVEFIIDGDGRAR